MKFGVGESISPIGAVCHPCGVKSLKIPPPPSNLNTGICAARILPVN